MLDYDIDVSSWTKQESFPDSVKQWSFHSMVDQNVSFLFTLLPPHTDSDPSTDFVEG